VEFVAFVRWNAFLLPCAKGTEVFSGEWCLVLEKFKHNTSLASFVTFTCYFDVEEHLRVFRIESRQSFLNLGRLGSLFVVVSTLTEELGHGVSLFLLGF
jgi:hypothetical protein